MKRRGNPNLAIARQQAVAAAKVKATNFAHEIEPKIIEIMRRFGTTSAKRIAVVLKHEWVPTARGGKWTAVQVGALFRRIDPDGTKRAAVAKKPQPGPGRRGLSSLERTLVRLITTATKSSRAPR